MKTMETNPNCRAADMRLSQKAVLTCQPCHMQATLPASGAATGMYAIRCFEKCATAETDLKPRRPRSIPGSPGQRHQRELEERVERLDSPTEVIGCFAATATEPAPRVSSRV